MKKRILALVLILALALGASGGAALAASEDKLHAARQLDGFLAPSTQAVVMYNRAATRLQVGEQLAQLAKCLCPGLPAADPAVRFADCDSELVRLAVTLDLMDGVTDAAFDPEGTLSRGYTACLFQRVLYRLGDRLGRNLLPLPPAEEPVYADVAEDAWYRQDVERLAANGYRFGAAPAWFSGEGKVPVGDVIALCYDVYVAVKGEPPLSGAQVRPPMPEQDPDHVGASPFKPAAGSILEHYVPTQGSKSSSWAREELTAAAKRGLIPDRLAGADMTLGVTRAEFAAVTVKLYEAMTGETAVPAAENPFGDTEDGEVLKALALGVTNGYGSDSRFAPEAPLTREEAAAMLCRVYKKAALPGWSLETDGEYPLSYTQPQPFDDDGAISGWARESVYFMAAHGVIQGSGGKFLPRGGAEAQASREQAILMAVRMAEKLS